MRTKNTSIISVRPGRICSAAYRNTLEGMDHYGDDPRICPSSRLRRQASEQILRHPYRLRMTRGGMRGMVRVVIAAETDRYVNKSNPLRGFVPQRTEGAIHVRSTFHARSAIHERQFKSSRVSAYSSRSAEHIGRVDAMNWLRHDLTMSRIGCAMISRSAPFRFKSRRDLFRNGRKAKS